MYKLDFKKLVIWLTPQWLRKSTILLLLQVFIMPVRDLFDSLNRFVDAKLYRLNHNSQVCYLRAVLNDKFDFFQRRILIGDFEGRERIYFWPQADRRDVNFENTQFFWPDSAYADSGVDFTVKIPEGVAFNQSEMARLNAEIREYKLPGKNYNIVRI